MCSYSMVADHYRAQWQPTNWPYQTLPHPLSSAGSASLVLNQSEVSRAEFNELRRDVQQMKALLERAKEYDAKNGEPDCEMEEKVELIRKVAKLVGVDLGPAAP